VQRPHHRGQAGGDWPRTSFLQPTNAVYDTVVCVEAIEYFCYISRNKVDQLYQQLDPQADYEVTEQTQQQTDVKTDWKIGQVLTLFSAGRSYGKSSVLQREAKVKRTYLEKLEQVMRALARDASIPDISDLEAKGHVPSPHYHYTGRFRISKPIVEPFTDAVVTLTSPIGARTLLLDCSLRNFSEGPQPDGTFALNSANARFFRQDLELTMTTVFLLLAEQEHRVIGSPLFLKLSLSSTDRMTML
jgi:hypothetical protein